MVLETNSGTLTRSQVIKGMIFSVK